MSPSQLAQVVCALAAAGSSKHIQLVTLTDPPARVLSLEMLRSCHGVASIWPPFSVGDNSSVTSPEDLMRRRYPRGLTNVLFVTQLIFPTDVFLLNEPPLEELFSLSRWLLIVQPNLLRDSLQAFHGRIDNKAVFIESSFSGLSAWETYRTGPSEETEYRRLSTVSIPPLQAQLDVLKREPWYRRTNLTGLTLRCSLKNYTPFAVLTKLPGGSVSVSGLLGDVMEALQTFMQMRIECREPEDNKWGAIRTPDGNWVGVLGDVFHGRADIALPFYYPMPERQEAFEFSHPIGEDWIVLVIQRPNALDGSNNYTKELTTETWAVIFVLFGLSIYVSNAFTRFYNSEVQLSWGLGLITNIRIFCNMGWGELEPRGTALRTWTQTLLVAVMVLHVCYSSSLITILTSNRLVLPFTDLQGLYDAEDEYTLGFEVDSIMDKMFKGATTGLFKSLRDDLISKHPEFIEDIKEGLDRVSREQKHTYLMSKLLVPKKCTTRWQDGVSAVTGHSEQDCRLMSLPPRLFSSHMSMMMAKGLPSAPIINYALLKMHEGGLLQRLMDKYELVAAATQSTESLCAAQLATPLGLKETYTAVRMLVAGWCAAVVVLILEILIKKRKQRTE